jgi:hypothetical protein
MTAWNVTDWQGWVRTPADIGHPFGTQYFADTYLSVEPVVSGEADEGGSSTLWIILIAAVVVVAAVVAWLALRGRGRAEEV